MRIVPVRTIILSLTLRLFIWLAVMTAIAALSPARATPIDDAVAATYVVRSADAEDRFLGSAFRWRDGAVAVTNAHVVGAADSVTLVDAAGVEARVQVIAKDEVRDVAVLGLGKGAGPGLEPAPTPGLGEEVWAIGAPLGAAFTVTKGMVSAQARQVEAEVPLRMVQHDAAVNPGSSGGPLIDAEGRLVGMNSQIADGSRTFIGIAYAISASDLDRIVTGLVEETLLPVPHLGLQLRPLTRAIAAALDVPEGGALVDRVEEDGAAERGGLQAGDVIVAASAQALADPGALAFAMEASAEQGALAVQVVRAGDLVELTLPLDPPDETATLRDVGEGARVAEYSLETLGVTTDATRIATLTDNSPAMLSGLAEGDRILSVNGTAATPETLAALTIDAPALFLIQRPGSGTRHVLIDPWDTTGSFRPSGGANVLDPDVIVF